MMVSKGLVFIPLVVLVFVCGCLPGMPGGAQPTTTTQPKVYVTPCNVVDNDTILWITSPSLADGQIASELTKYYPDDFSTPGVNIPSTYTFKCHWAYRIGETKDYMYCDGSYKAPEFDNFNIIRRYVWKKFTIGFKVEEQDVGTWVDSKGVTHKNDKSYHLYVREVSATCYVA